jgi:hypothetical protein
MSLKDKLEIGLKPDAPYRPDNLPEHQQDDPDCVDAAEPGNGPEQRDARARCDEGKAPNRTTNTQDELAETRFIAEGGKVK